MRPAFFRAIGPVALLVAASPASAAYDEPAAVAVAPDGAVLVADRDNNRIRRREASGREHTIAWMSRPTALARTSDGGLLVAEAGARRVRKLLPGGSAATLLNSSRLVAPSDVAVLPAGGFLVADRGAGSVRRVWPNGYTATVLRGLREPEGLAVTADGGYLVADTGNHRVLRVTPGKGMGLAARVPTPSDVVPLPDGEFLVVDRRGDRLRKVTAAGAVTSFAPGLRLDEPEDAVLDARGGLVVADTGNDRVLRLRPPTPTPAPLGVPKRLTLPPVLPEKPPVLRRTLNIAPVKGRVRVRRPRSRRAKRLSAAVSVPVKSLVAPGSGTVRLTAAGGGPELQTADFWGGTFAALQTKTAITELRLKGATPRCGTKKAGIAKRRRSRGLWGSGHGRFRTRGRFGAATVRGTTWLVEERCGGTFFAVREGVVSVRDFAKKRTVTLKAGDTYLARRPRRAKRVSSSGADTAKDPPRVSR